MEPRSAAFADSGRFTLTQSQAVILLIIYCLIYVLPLHIFPSARASPTRSRDDPSAIRARIRAVSFSTAICSLVTLLILTYLPPTDEATAFSDLSPWHLMGYWPVGFGGTGKAVGLTMVLFAGPLYEMLVVDGRWRLVYFLSQPGVEFEMDWPLWRNLVAGPITEECLFRSSSVPLLLLTSTPLTTTIILSPLIFGLAHLHHFHEFRISNPTVPLPAAIARSILQLSYTTLFGAYATFLFLRTGSLLAVVLVHTFCNCMGLPRVWGAVEPCWMSWEEMSVSRVGSVRAWTAGYYVLLVAGAALWWKNLFSWTESDMVLAEF